MQADRQADRQTCRKTCRKTYRQADRQTDMQEDRPTDMQADRQTNLQPPQTLTTPADCLLTKNGSVKESWVLARARSHPRCKCAETREMGMVNQKRNGQRTDVLVSK